MGCSQTKSGKPALGENLVGSAGRICRDSVHCVLSRFFSAEIDVFVKARDQFFTAGGKNTRAYGAPKQRGACD
jgi:hypothetical protein